MLNNGIVEPPFLDWVEVVLRLAVGAEIDSNVTAIVAGLGTRAMIPKVDVINVLEVLGGD